ncbi:hypothetical protein DNH61_11580 [Paenibacillus sambharensis]|uniref:Uncharacterized protein n=1 Tax=Paenibacillus sambharensis TaxID=1803190 RepID=A0A2W1L8F8_9BACL|nr:hypothetical protein DNH61_11580 [Paenibacillus sambharensis]
MLFRILNIILSLVVASAVFTKIYDEYYSYLPDYEKLELVNNSDFLIENSHGLRDLYNHAFEQSVLYAFMSFIILVLILEYIRHGFNIRKARRQEESLDSAVKKINDKSGIW